MTAHVFSLKLKPSYSERWLYMVHISQRGIGIVGARALPDSFRDQVSQIVRYLLDRGYQIHSGGAMGADSFALDSVISSGAINRCTIFSAWASVTGFPVAVRPAIEHFVSHDGRVIWGITQPRSSRGLVFAGLMCRNQRLVSASTGIVAFLFGESRGTISTIRRAIQRGIRVVVFVCGGAAVLPDVSATGRWHQLRCSSPWGGAYLYRPFT